MFEFDGQAVGRVGSGRVVGERASLESDWRTGHLQAATDARIREVRPTRLDPAQSVPRLACRTPNIYSFGYTTRPGCQSRPSKGA
jgi:hypothetical protein